MPTTGNYFHLHLVSDSTGETLITVARAVAGISNNRPNEAARRMFMRAERAACRYDPEPYSRS